MVRVRHRSLVAALAVAACLAPAARGGRLPQSAFTLIADDAGDFAGLSTPSINNAGTVAFSATLDNGDAGVFTGAGGRTSTVADSNGPFSLFFDPVINNVGQTAYVAQGAGGAAIFRDSTTIADSAGFANFLAPIDLNDAGVVAFTGAQIVGGGGPGPVAVGGVFTGAGGAVTTVADAGDFPGFPGGVAINDPGAVAFVAVDTSGGPGEPGVFIASGGGVSAITSAGGASFVGAPRSLSMSNGSVAAFVGVTAGLSGIFSGVGGPADAIADTGDPYAAFSASSTNEAGGVAFEATRNSGGEGVFIGPSPATDALIATGDPLFGSTVTSLTLGPAGLSNSGFAFRATLADGRTVIARGDIALIPEPSTLALLTVGCLTACGSRRR